MFFNYNRYKETFNALKHIDKMKNIFLGQKDLGKFENLKRRRENFKIENWEFKRKRKRKLLSDYFTNNILFY